MDGKASNRKSPLRKDEARRLNHYSARGVNYILVAIGIFRKGGWRFVYCSRCFIGPGSRTISHLARSSSHCFVKIGTPGDRSKAGAILYTVRIQLYVSSMTGPFLRPDPTSHC